jgi:hypothetical protein
MSKKASKAKHPDRLYNIVVRVKGSTKNEIMDAAKKNGMTLNDYVLYCIWEHTRAERGIPSPGPSQFSLSTPMDQIRAYISGETLLKPCGRVECDMVLVEFQDMTFCETCNARVE